MLQKKIQSCQSYTPSYISNFSVRAKAKSPTYYFFYNTHTQTYGQQIFFFSFCLFSRWNLKSRASYIASCIRQCSAISSQQISVTLPLSCRNVCVCVLCAQFILFQVYIEKQQFFFNGKETIYGYSSQVKEKKTI